MTATADTHVPSAPYLNVLVDDTVLPQLAELSLLVGAPEEETEHVPLSDSFDRGGSYVKDIAA